MQTRYAIFILLGLLTACAQPSNKAIKTISKAPHIFVNSPKILPPQSPALDTAAIAIADVSSPLPENWYKQAVFMEIYIRGYQDSDGDGIGDFNGLRSRLDYLANLGIKGLWLMPMMKSQDRDHGYAVSDYRAVEPDYGSQADFKRLLDEAHKRGIGIIIDYVLNHSSKQNPLFFDSNHNLDNKRDWYNWSETKLPWVNWGRNSTWHQGENGYYYGIFWEGMPDFNLRHPDVVAYHQNSLRYWLNMGVDGFRFDAVGALFENGWHKHLNQAENHQFLLEQIQPTIHAYDKRFMVCENPDGAIDSAHSCGSSFYFGLNHSILSTVKQQRIHANLLQQIEQAPMQKMANILANHDSFAGDRIIHQLSNDQAKYRMAAATLMTMPGIPFIYYGEEIGMGHSARVDNDQDHRLRSPMSWTGDSPKVGFSQGRPFRAAAKNAAQYNVATEQAEPNSLLAYYQALIALRNANPALQLGDFVALKTGSASVLSFTRSYLGQTLVVSINYSSKMQTIHHPVYTGCRKPLFGEQTQGLKDGLQIDGQHLQVDLLCNTD